MGRAFARRARRAAAERDRQIAARQEAARAQIEDLVRRFRSEDPHIRRIILFGSLAAGTPRNPHFDIDLAVDSDRYWELQLDIERLAELRHDLDPKCVATVQEGVPATLTLFRAARDRFTADLAAMIVAREDETANDR